MFLFWITFAFCSALAVFCFFLLLLLLLFSQVFRRLTQHVYRRFLCVHASIELVKCRVGSSWAIFTMYGPTTHSGSRKTDMLLFFETQSWVCKYLEGSRRYPTPPQHCGRLLVLLFKFFCRFLLLLLFALTSFVFALLWNEVPFQVSMCKQLAFWAISKGSDR